MRQSYHERDPPVKNQKLKEDIFIERKVTAQEKRARAYDNMDDMQQLLGDIYHPIAGLLHFIDKATCRKRTAVYEELLGMVYTHLADTADNLLQTGLLLEDAMQCCEEATA